MVVAPFFRSFRILLDYAFWGVPLLFMRRWSTRSLLVAALVSMSALSLVETAKGAHEWFTLGRQGADAVAEARRASPNPTWTALKTAQAQPGYPALVRARLRAMRADYLRWAFLIPGANLALFILGFLALRRAVFDSPKKHTRIILVFMAVGIFSWAVWWLFLRNLNTNFVPQRITAQFRNGFGILSEQWLAFAYIGGIVLLLAYRPAWERRLAAFGMAGRMALTNYLIQIAVLDVLSWCRSPGPACRGAPVSSADLRCRGRGHAALARSPSPGPSGVALALVYLWKAAADAEVGLGGTWLEFFGGGGVYCWIQSAVD